MTSPFTIRRRIFHRPSVEGAYEVFHIWSARVIIVAGGLLIAFNVLRIILTLILEQKP